jgi:PPOX class probable F420-dependent enzyme
MSVIPDSDFGNRLRARLRDEPLIWLTTIGADGTPQPNPVWYLWEEDDDALLIYNANAAHRIAHVAARPQVALNFDADSDGGNVMVFAGTAEHAGDAPASKDHDDYLAKYAERIVGIGSNQEKFAQDYSVPLRIRITKVRGF